MNLDYGTLEKFSGSYTTSHLSERTDDIVWRLKTQDEDWYYVYVIAEFQSKNDKWMAARIAEYVAELRMELIRAKIVKGDELLPPILPIVLYRGVSKWTSSKKLSQIQVSLPEPLTVTHDEYVLVDIHRLAQESLESETTVPSVFFRMERASNFEELRPILQEACEHFKGPHYEEIKRILLQWCKLVALPRYGFDKKAIPDVLTLEELTEMPYQYVDEAEREYYTKWKKDLIDTAYNDGEKNGIDKGDKNARLSIARTLASNGFDTEKIASFTGLSSSEVKTALQANP